MKHMSITDQYGDTLDVDDVGGDTLFITSCVSRGGVDKTTEIELNREQVKTMRRVLKLWLQQSRNGNSQWN